MKNIDFNNKNLDELKGWYNGFHFYYTYNSSFYTKTEDKRSLVLGNKKIRICRYCRRNENEVFFRNKAHTIPKTLGNTFVKCYYECDECNSIFGKYETDLTNFIGLRGYIEPKENYGYKKLKTYKSNSGKGVLYTSKRGIEISDLNNEIFEEIEKGRVLKSKINKKPFVPLLVYKSLIKSCLSVIKNEAMEDYEETLKFLLTSNKDNELIIKWFSILPNIWLGDFHINYPIIYIFKKSEAFLKSEENKRVIIPDKTFLIYFKDICYQVFVPFERQDANMKNYDQNNILFPLYPPIIGQPKTYDKFNFHPKYQHDIRYLSSNIKVVDEKDELYFESLIEPELHEYSIDDIKQMKDNYKLKF